MQRLVRPGRSRAAPAARPPDPAQPHLGASCAFAAACADRVRGPLGPRAGGAWPRADGAAPPDRPHAPAARGAAKAERLSSAAAETTTRAVKPPMSRRPLQRLVRPGAPGPHAAAQPPGPAQPHLCASCAFAADCAYKIRRPSGPRAGGAVTASFRNTPGPRRIFPRTGRASRGCGGWFPGLSDPVWGSGGEGRMPPRASPWRPNKSPRLR